MKTSNRNFQQLSAVLILTLGLTILFPFRAHAGFETVNEWKEATLNGIEDFVKDTGLVDLKKKLLKDYGLLIKPFLRLNYKLSSNPFHARDNDADTTDNIWSFVPGVQLQYTTPYGVIGGAYEAIFTYYTQFSNQNEQDQKFLVYANLFPTENTYLRVSEKIVQEGPIAANTAFDPVNYMDNRVTVVTGYNAGDLTFEFGYENFDRDFNDDLAERYNYNEDKFDYRTYYQLNEEARVYAGARLGLVDFQFDSSRETVYFEFPVGFEGMLPGDVMMRASVGFHRRNLEHHARNDLNHIVTNISLEKKFNQDRTFVQLGFLRRPVESAFATATTYDEKMWYGQAQHVITPRLRGRFNLFLANRDWEDGVFIGSRVFIANTNIVLVSSGDKIKRDDDVFGLGLGFDYRLRKWLIVHTDYRYQRRRSNFQTTQFGPGFLGIGKREFPYNYDENSFTLGATIPL